MDNNINKILIIRTGAIGDVVHTTNLYRAIKKSDPNIEIHYLTSKLKEKISLFSDYTKELAEILKNEKYDLAINLQPSLKIKYLLFLAGIKKQLIYRKTFKLHAVKNFWQTGLKAFPEIKEEKELKLYLPLEAIDKAKEKVKDLKRPLTVINAGGVFSKRQGRTYPINKWVELGEKIIEKTGGTIILNGAKEDKEILSDLNKIPNCVNFIGELSLVESCAVISQADLMISGDSGPLHIATALGVKSIGLYGSMPANRTGCYSNGINIISKKECVPCNRRKCKYLKKSKKLFAPCMEEISTESILSLI